MRWIGRRQSGNIVDQRSFGAGSLGIGGVVIGAIFYFLMGGNPLDYVAQNVGPATRGPASTSSPPSQAEEENKNFAAVVLADTEDVWTQQFAKYEGQYPAPQMVLFRGRTRSGCGSASSQVGPFYCGADRRIYLDLSFFDELSTKLGAKGDTAAAYVIAHEVGHHVQTVLGLDQKSYQQLGRTKQASVAIELQADCLAGIWASHMDKTEVVFEPGDIEEAMGAASAVGDDRLQRMAGQEVQPESFTHGSSAQRVAAFQQGYRGGDLKSCLQ